MLRLRRDGDAQPKEHVKNHSNGSNGENNSADPPKHKLPFILSRRGSGNSNNVGQAAKNVCQKPDHDDPARARQAILFAATILAALADALNLDLRECRCPSFMLLPKKAHRGWDRWAFLFFLKHTFDDGQMQKDSLFRAIDIAIGRHHQ